MRCSLRFPRNWMSAWWADVAGALYETTAGDSHLMGNSGSSSDDVFDVRRVRRLVELMQEFELAEIDLRQAEQRIRLRKDQDPVVVPGGYAAAPAPVAAQPQVPAAAMAVSQPAAAESA